jgi:hypothetical protein
MQLLQVGLMIGDERSLLNAHDVSKDEKRAEVLRFYYAHNEKHPGNVEQTIVVARTTGLDTSTVLEAQQYLVDKGFLNSGPRQQIRALGEGLVAMFARITDSGIDFVENPGDWKGREVPAAFVNIFTQGDVSGINVAGRDQQIIGGDVVDSAVAQGNARINYTPFPIDQLRSLLTNEPEALAAAESINEEVSSAKPLWGKVMAAFETFNGIVAVGEAAHIVTQWFMQPGVPEFVHNAVTAIAGI